MPAKEVLQQWLAQWLEYQAACTCTGQVLSDWTDNTLLLQPRCPHKLRTGAQQAAECSSAMQSCNLLHGL